VRRRATIERDGRRRGRHLPGDVLRRHLPRARRLPARGRARRPPSRWGPYHYEVADTKLARHVKASAVLQICSYVDQLERLQGVRPEWLHVALGGSARSGRDACASTTTWRTTGASATGSWRRWRDRRRRVPAARPTRSRRPLRGLPLGGRMRTVRRADDHLSLVAGISGRQRRR
jgi:uncharacterized protein